MKSYPAYKESGIEWVGEIPEHWENWKVAHAFPNIGSGTTPKSDNPEYHQNGTINWINTGDLNDGILYSCKKKITSKALDDYSTLKVFPKESLIIAMYGATIGKTCITAFEATTNQACCVLSKSEVINTKFSFYWFIANKRHVVSMSYGGGQPNISQDLIRNLRLSAPPLEEQTAIANFLDHKTAQIDGSIEKRRELITLLQEHRAALINEAVTKGINPHAPMKDSGIEWIGEIPEHWVMKKVKHITTKIGSGVTPRGGAETYLTEGVLLLRSQNIYFDGLRLDDVACISEEVHKSMANSTVYDGDVLLNITGGSIGRCYFADSRLGEANVNQHVCIVRPDLNQVKTGYLYYYLRSNLGQEQIEMCQTGANREGLNFEQLKQFLFPYPDITEQQQIVDFIEAETNRIDEEITLAQQEIDLLEEYRQSLIAEAVTGKIDVRDYTLN